MPKNGIQKNSEIKIRCLVACDIDAVVEIEKKSHADPWSRGSFEKELQLEYSDFFVAVKNHEIIGYICFRKVEDEGELMNITVKQGFQGKGLGSILMKYIIDISYAMKIKKMFLEVRAKNYMALKFYKKFGFRKIGLRKKYYSNSDDAVVMSKTL